MDTFGGWAYVLFVDDFEIHISGNKTNTTNNKMELQAVIEVLRNHKDIKSFIIHSDSMYVINCAKGLWKRKKNVKLWKEYDQTLNNRRITWKKVKAHSGNKYNEIVDRMAKKEAFHIKKNKKILNINK